MGLGDKHLLRSWILLNGLGFRSVYRHEAPPPVASKKERSEHVVRLNGLVTSISGAQKLKHSPSRPV